MPASFKKVPQAQAVEIVIGAPGLGVEAAGLFTPGKTPRAFLDELKMRTLHGDAVRFLAHALPKREAVWWACVCARDTLSEATPEPVSTALSAAEEWVFRPTEENRRAAMERANSVGFKTPSGWAAVAAFWSGGSMAPPDAPAVPPGETLTASAAAGAILLAAVQTEPERAAEKFGRFLDYGYDIADGGNGRRR
jgi:hypothetical protein